MKRPKKITGTELYENDDLRRQQLQGARLLARDEDQALAMFLHVFHPDHRLTQELSTPSRVRDMYRERQEGES